jgi:two-component system CheB/CheR fusion protein
MAGDGLESSAPEPLKRIVGIGASAGGLEALQALAANLLPGSQASYVVAQHLAPEHRSLIVHLLGRISPLPVITAVEGALLQADVIAIAPPHHDVTVEGDRLRVREPIARFGPSPHIDLLFDSIAATWGEKGAAVVLSGTGSDGARGLRAVRAAGGLTLVQTP